jgi:hypothetical protein
MPPERWSSTEAPVSRGISPIGSSEAAGRPSEWRGDCSLEYGHIVNSDLSLVRVIGCVEDDEDAEAWVTPFLAGEGFRQARVYQTEHDFCRS